MPQLLWLSRSDVILALAYVLLMMAEDAYTAEQSLTNNCMSSLLQSYGIPANRSDVYAQRMADKRFDERTLRMYSGLDLLLRLHLQAFKLTESDLAIITACLRKVPEGKSSLCKPTPCGGSGTCAFSESDRRKYVCDCHPGFIGTYCEKDLCSPNPCHHKAACYHTASGFLCDCSGGYTGKTCDIATNECKSSPCQNGGSCEDGHHNYTCNCPFGYDGVYCEQMWFKRSEYQHLVQTVALQDAENRRHLAEIDKLKSEVALQDMEIGRQLAKIESLTSAVNTLNLTIHKARHNVTMTHSTPAENRLHLAEIEKLKSAVKTLNQTSKNTRSDISSLQAQQQAQGVCKAARGIINWQQTTKINMDSKMDNGPLVKLEYQKLRDDTHLRLTWSSNMRQYLYLKCSRWYFTIDGLECSNPAPIDGNLLHKIDSGYNNDVHRHGTIIGVCRGTSEGHIDSGKHHIAMNIRSDCKGSHSGGDANSGWQSTTTMIVEELCPPQ